MGARLSGRHAPMHVLAWAFRRVRSASGKIWHGVRRLSGDDAYERYLAHHAACHSNSQPLSPGEFFRRREREKWEGVRRCC